MQVKNTLSNKAESKIAEFVCGSETVKLSPSIIRNYLVSGGGSVTDQEIVMFLNLCRYQHLNPFLRDAYLIKYGDNPASMVTSKDVLIKRATRNKLYKGHKAGICVLDGGGNVENRVGTLKLEGEELVGGWAEVYMDGYDVPISTSVSFDEYVGKKSDGEVNGQWRCKPATMIRKVALVQALREAFPEDLQGMYSSEEMGVEDITDPVTVPDAGAPAEQPLQDNDENQDFFEQ